MSDDLLRLTAADLRPGDVIVTKDGTAAVEAVNPATGLVEIRFRDSTGNGLIYLRRHTPVRVRRDVHPG